jgi:hypothetical protein
MATKPLCSVPDCGKPAHCKGYCRNHYNRARTHGDPLAGKAAQGEPMAWIVRHRDHSGDACLIWPYGRFPNGYAAVVHEGKTTHASIVMSIEAHGPAPADSPFSLHSCGNGAGGCVHPKHLRWGTQAANMRDSVMDGTRCRGEAQHHAKLTVDAVREIRRLRGSMRQKDIASRYGIDPNTVRRVQKREAWAWLE